MGTVLPFVAEQRTWTAAVSDGQENDSCEQRTRSKQVGSLIFDVGSGHGLPGWPTVYTAVSSLLRRLQVLFVKRKREIQQGEESLEDVPFKRVSFSISGYVVVQVWHFW